jgi:hypothetical protein
MSQKIQVELELKKGKTIDDLGDIADGVNEIKSGAKAAEKGVGKFSTSLKNIGKVSGIVFLLQEAFELLKDTLGKNQKVLDFFNTGVESLSIAFNDLFKFLNQNVGTVIDYFKGLFDDPVQSIKNFASAIYDGIVKRLEQGLEALGLFGKAAIKFFAGDFAGAAMTAKEASKELFDVVTGEDGGFEKITESVKTTVASITNYAKSTVEAAKATVDLNKQAEVAAVINQGLIEKYDRQAEQQRQLRDDETKTIEERIAANNRLGEILDEQAEKMLENVDITIKAAQAEYDKNQNQENYIALLEAQNEREAILAQIEGFRSEQIINRISLEKEAADLKKEADEEELERLEVKKQKEIELEAQKKASIYGALDASIDAAGEETKLGKALFLAKQAMMIQEQVMAAKVTLQKILQKSEEGSVDLAVGGAKAAASAPPPANLINIAIFAAQAAGIISSIKSAVNAAKSTVGGSAGGGGSISAPSTPQAPAFNVVGAAPENQLAQVIGDQEQKPVKAFVVSSEVSNQQALDRKVETGASIG